MIYSVYERANGRFTGERYRSSDLKWKGPTLPATQAAITGAFDHLSQRVDLQTGEVVDYQPTQPSADHTWSPATKRWQLNATAQATLDARAAALHQIKTLEASQPRAVREWLL